MEQGLIRIRDRPAPFWALGLFLLAGGMLAIAMALGLATDAGELKLWERLASVGLGVGVCAGALWWLARSPGTEVQVDRARRVVRIVRWGIWGRRVQQLRFEELESTGLEQGEDSDGGKVCRPTIRLRSGTVVRLSELWSHDEARTRATVDTVAQVCRISRS